ncbi:hypothetical protein LX32DRAFT_658863 [Colletotrichum zoysiae]|uniref:Uncharacterized protein n=1 Tax=Colletotrichum zoysiae TaxID=1216348 RepID=A0AAD9H2A9_9PEZI|nr:hypothetical protein LX32DRAFT_658863 [Colletotrichum zoysiae]
MHATAHSAAKASSDTRSSSRISSGVVVEAAERRNDATTVNISSDVPPPLRGKHGRWVLHEPKMHTHGLSARTRIPRQRHGGDSGMQLVHVTPGSRLFEMHVS